ncbi:MAG: hypothetical protein D6820_18875, partial [Lentisphaerae bacterium]
AYERAIELLELKIFRHRRGSYQDVLELLRCCREERLFLRIDALRLRLAQTFRETPLVLYALAIDLLDDPYHWGCLDHDRFVRGTLLPGSQPVTSWARDPWQAILGLHQAVDSGAHWQRLAVAKKADILLGMARALCWYRGVEFAPHPLLSLTDLAVKPDLEHGHRLRYLRPSIPRFIATRPLSQLFFNSVSTWKDARSDGERLIFILDSLQKLGAPKRAWLFKADLARHWFAVSNLNSAQLSEAKQALAQLNDSEILRLYNGRIVRERMPTQWNFLSLYRQAEAWEPLARCYEARRQYRKALAIWQKLSGPQAESARKRLLAPRLALSSPHPRTMVPKIKLTLSSNGFASLRVEVFRLLPEEVFTIVRAMMNAGELPANFFHTRDWMNRFAAGILSTFPARDRRAIFTRTLPSSERIDYYHTIDYECTEQGLYVFVATARQESGDPHEKRAVLAVLYDPVLLVLRRFDGRDKLLLLDPHQGTLLSDCSVEIWDWPRTPGLASSQNKFRVRRFHTQQPGIILFPAGWRSSLNARYCLFMLHYPGGSSLLTYPVTPIPSPSVASLPRRLRAWMKVDRQYITPGESLHCRGTIPLPEPPTRDGYARIIVADRNGQQIVEVKLTMADYPLFSKRIDIPPALPPTQAIVTLVPGDVSIPIHILPSGSGKLGLSLQRASDSADLVCRIEPLSGLAPFYAQQKMKVIFSLTNSTDTGTEGETLVREFTTGFMSVQSWQKRLASRDFKPFRYLRVVAVDEKGENLAWGLWDLSTLTTDEKKAALSLPPYLIPTGKTSSALNEILSS